MNRVCPLFLMAIVTGCSPNSRKTAPPERVQEAAAPSYQIDRLTAGSVSGMIRYIGKGPSPKKIDMRRDLACVEACGIVDNPYFGLSGEDGKDRVETCLPAPTTSR